MLPQPPFSLAGKIAFVTGAATGLGAAISAALAGSGADVAISDKPGNSLDKTAANVGASALTCQRETNDKPSTLLIQNSVASISS